MWWYPVDVSPRKWWKIYVGHRHDCVSYCVWAALLQIINKRNAVVSVPNKMVICVGKTKGTGGTVISESPDERVTRLAARAFNFYKRVHRQPVYVRAQTPQDGVNFHMFGRDYFLLFLVSGRSQVLDRKWSKRKTVCSEEFLSVLTEAIIILYKHNQVVLLPETNQTAK